MNTHHLKTHPEPFAALRVRRKTAEFRKNDREFQVGDRLYLEEWDPGTGKYTGAAIMANILHIATGFGIPDGFCMLSIRMAPRSIEEKAVAFASRLLSVRFDADESTVEDVGLETGVLIEQSPEQIASCQKSGFCRCLDEFGAEGNVCYLPHPALPAPGEDT